VTSVNRRLVAQFNPVVTAADWILGRRTEHRYEIGQAAAVIVSQVAGAIAGARRSEHAPWAVGAWIGAAYWFTASTAFANPAVTIGRTLTNTSPGSRPVLPPRS
jgi:glycerol uptake facilitator-like aquaporin